jgi:hypothetical protein
MKINNMTFSDDTQIISRSKSFAPYPMTEADTSVRFDEIHQFTRHKQIQQTIDDAAKRPFGAEFESKMIGGETAKRYQSAKDTFIESILTKLASLLSHDCDRDDNEPPLLCFNIIHSHPLQDIADPRIRIFQPNVRN